MDGIVAYFLALMHTLYIITTIIAITEFVPAFKLKLPSTFLLVCTTYLLGRAKTGGLGQVITKKKQEKPQGH